MYNTLKHNYYNGTYDIRENKLSTIESKHKNITKLVLVKKPNGAVAFINRGG